MVTYRSGCFGPDVWLTVGLAGQENIIVFFDGEHETTMCFVQPISWGGKLGKAPVSE